MDFERESSDDPIRESSDDPIRESSVDPERESTKKSKRHQCSNINERDGVPEPLTGGHHARKTPRKRKQRARRQGIIRRKEESADKEALRDCFEHRYKDIGKPLWLKDLHATKSFLIRFLGFPGTFSGVFISMRLCNT